MVVQSLLNHDHNDDAIRRSEIWPRQAANIGPIISSALISNA